jgi:hypothetical protein
MAFSNDALICSAEALDAVFDLIVYAIRSVLENGADRAKFFFYSHSA